MFPIYVSASPTPADSEAFKSALQTFLSTRSLTADENALYKWSTVIAYLKADGMNDYAIAGFMGCWIYEAGNALYAVEGHGAIKTKEGKYYTEFASGGVYDYGVNTYPPHSASLNSSGEHVGSGGNGLGGVAQWTWGREDNLSNFCTVGVDDGCKLPSDCGYVTVSHNEFRYEKPRWDYDASGKKQPYWVYRTHRIPDLPGQMLFALHELKHIAYYKNGCYDKLPSVTNATDATKLVYQWFEGNGNNWSGSMFTTRAAAAEKAVAAVQAFTGVTGSAPVVTDPVTGEQTSAWDSPASQQAASAALVNFGIWGTSQLSRYCALTETNLDEVLLRVANIDDLRQTDLEGLIGWQRNNKSQQDEHGYIQILRWIVVFVGIMFICWATLVYIAYWFDHINSFIYLDLLHLITFGQLHICPPGEKPTFKLKNAAPGKKTVSHFQLVCICLVAIMFGVLLVSGTFYIFVQAFVDLILRVTGG